MKLKVPRQQIIKFGHLHIHVFCKFRVRAKTVLCDTAHLRVSYTSLWILRLREPRIIRSGARIAPIITWRLQQRLNKKVLFFLFRFCAEQQQIMIIGALNLGVGRTLAVTIEQKLNDEGFVEGGAALAQFSSAIQPARQSISFPPSEAPTKAQRHLR